MKSASSRAEASVDARAQGAGCIHAFREQFDFVYRCVQRHGVKGAEVDDVVQEVFIAMWRRWADFDTSRPLRPWLAGIAFRVARNHQRKQRWDRVPTGLTTGEGGAELEVADVNDLLARSDEHHQAREARELVVTALARLPERYRSPLVLHDLDEVSVNEIARLLELPLATVYTRLRRARLAFAKVVGELRGAQSASYARALAPLQLLAFERKLPPAPALARTRAELFARSVAELPAPPPDPLAGEGLAGTGARAGRLSRMFERPRVWLAAGALVGAGLLAGGRARDRAARVAPPVTASAPAAIATRSPQLPGARRRSLPVFRAPAATTATFSPEVAASLGRGLTGYWPMDDGPGARTVRDHSGAGRDCRFHDQRPGERGWIPGVAGRALALHTATWLDCPQPEVQREQVSEMTWAAWVKRRSPASPAAVVTRQIGTGFEDQFFLGYKDGSLRLLGHAWAGGGLTAPAPPPSERWHHIAFTRDGDGSNRLYLDGALVAEGIGDARGSGVIATPITIGAGRYSRFGSQVRQRFDGAVDEVLAYGRALSALELRALAAGIRPVLPATVAGE